MTSPDTPRKKVKYKPGYTEKSVKESRTPPRDPLLVELEQRDKEHDTRIVERVIDRQNALEKISIEQGSSVLLRPMSMNTPYGEIGDPVLFRHTPKV